ncbi:hypothetical protein JW960_16785 [candidate division KSB1 bacterium]|nr:hypothetical protein [candidate division KSB1 bacterium]
MRELRSLFWLFIALLFYQCSAVTSLNQQRTMEGPTFTPYQGLKRRIAVVDFQNTTSHGDEQFGSAVADRLISLLMRSGRFTIIERQQIETIMQEQALGQSGTMTDETAPMVGKLLGVQAIVLGTIIEAEQETGAHNIKNDEKDDKNDWALALKATVGHVKIAYRMIDTATGEVILADNVTGTEFRPGFGFKNKEFDFTDMFELDQTVIGFALRKAIISMAEKIVEQAPTIAWQGKIIKVNEDNTLYFTPGMGSGISSGDVFRVYREHPIGDDPELTELMAIGLVRVHGFIGNNIAKATILEGEALERGNIVKRMKGKPTAETSVQ